MSERCENCSCRKMRETLLAIAALHEALRKDPGRVDCRINMSAAIKRGKQLAEQCGEFQPQPKDKTDDQR